MNRKESHTPKILFGMPTSRKPTSRDFRSIFCASHDTVIQVASGMWDPSLKGMEMDHLNLYKNPSGAIPRQNL